MSKARDISVQAFKDLKSELRDWDLHSVAEAAEVSQSTLYLWLSGKTKCPRLLTMYKVARVIGYEVYIRKV